MICGPTVVVVVGPMEKFLWWKLLVNKRLCLQLVKRLMLTIVAAV